MPFSLTWWSWRTASSSSCSERGQWPLTCALQVILKLVALWGLIFFIYLFFIFWLGQVWERRDVFGECQKLHSLLPNSRGAQCHHPDELLWGDHCQSLGQSLQAVFVCGQLSTWEGGGGYVWFKALVFLRGWVLSWNVSIIKPFGCCLPLAVWIMWSSAYFTVFISLSQRYATHSEVTMQYSGGTCDTWYKRNDGDEAQYQTLNSHKEPGKLVDYRL